MRKKLEDAGGLAEFVGQFRINDAPMNMIITDPCYDTGTWCTARLSVKPGLYDCYLEYVDFKEQGGLRIVAVEARNIDCREVEPKLLAKNTTIGVDSACCGIYDMAYFINHQKECCNEAPYKQSHDYKLLSNGIMSISGWGDGAYPLYLGYNSQSQIVSVRVEYIDLTDIKNGEFA